MKSSLLKVTGLLVASMILFWFGVFWETIILLGSYVQYEFFGQLKSLMPFESQVLNAINFVYGGFGHIVHIIAGFWLSKGTKKGYILGMSVSLFEIIAFIVPAINPVIFTPDGLSSRILFGIIIILLIISRKELNILRKMNWRPWNILTLIKYFQGKIPK